MMKMIRVLAILTMCALLFTAALADKTPELYGKDQLTALLDNIVDDIRPGTAGCSLRTTARTAELMKWGMNTDLSDEEITQVAAQILEKVPDAQKAEFDEVMNDIYSTYCSLLTDADKAMLEDAGCDPNEYDFSEVEAIPAVETAMAAVGAVS